MLGYIGCFVVGVIVGGVLVWIYKSRIAEKVGEVKDDIAEKVDELGDRIKGD